MDNTILRSRIDFTAMHRELAAILRGQGLERWIRPSCAATLQAFADSPDYQPQLAAAMWDMVSRLEQEGMKQAEEEPGAKAALAILAEKAVLAVLTNNTEANLERELGRLGLLPYLSYVVGRDSVARLKPEPDGMLLVRERFPHIPASRVLAVGDAYIDAIAAERAGIGFVAYNNSRQENWAAHNIHPLLQLVSWDAASVARLISLLESLP